KWVVDGNKITAPEKLAAIRDTIESQGPIIVQHWFYRGASSPERIIFEDYDEFLKWLHESTYAGDAIDVWDWGAVCKWEDRLAEGKCPDENEMVPKGGAY